MTQQEIISHFEYIADRPYTPKKPEKKRRFRITKKMVILVGFFIALYMWSYLINP